MNTARHAEDILEAWMFADEHRLEAAVRNASPSAPDGYPDSGLDEERKELLESIVERLSVHAEKGVFPEFSQIRGAIALLRHLSSTPSEKIFRTEFGNFFANTLKFISGKDEMLFRSRKRSQG
jgi:hypothetical protein